MSTNMTLMRLYLKMQSMPRLPLPHIGAAGILYSQSLMERHRFAYREDICRPQGSPEVAGTGNNLIKKGALGTYSYRRYSTSVSVEDVKKAEKAKTDKKKFKLMTAETAKIMLVSETGTLSTMTLQDAASLAKKKRLELIHIVNDKEKPVRTDKEIYKLVSPIAALDPDESESESGKEKHKKDKDEKTMIVKSNIGEHDVNSKVNMLLKWMDKGHRTRVLIGQAGDKGNAETVFIKFESRIKEVDGQVQQKILKGNEIRFYVAPPKLKPVVTTKAKPGKPKSVEEKPNEDEYSDSGSESDNDEHRKKKRNRNKTS